MMKVLTLIATVSNNSIANKICNIPNASYNSDWNFPDCFRPFFF